MSAKTYRVRSGTAMSRLDNLTAPWIDISLHSHGIPGAYTGTHIRDVQTVPGNNNFVWVCGDRNKDGGFQGLAYSTDAGTTWHQPTGGTYTQDYYPNMSLNTGWWKIWVVNINTIYATSYAPGMVTKSTNGGATFNNCTQLPAAPQYYGQSGGWHGVPCIHFIDTLRGVVGGLNNVFTTNDGGVTWTAHGIHIESSGLITPGTIYGVHMDSTGQIITAVGHYTIERSTDGGYTWTPVYTFNPDGGIHLTAYSDDVLYAFGAGGLIIKSTDGGITWTEKRAYDSSKGPHEAGHFYTTKAGFFSSLNDDIAGESVDMTIDSGITASVNYPFSESTHALWTEGYTPNCYLLTMCEGETYTPPISPFVVSGTISSSVIQIHPPFKDLREDVCFTVTPTENCEGAIPITSSNYTAYRSCVECMGTCYQLTNCDDPTDIIYTNTDLSDYVGHAIHIAFNSATGTIIDSRCWMVTTCKCDYPLTSVVFQNDAGTCEECLRGCFLLTNCNDETESYIVSADLDQFINQYIHLTDFHGNKCWLVTRAPICSGAVTITEPDVAYKSCEDCGPICYLLIDCNGILPNVLISNDLSQFIGQYIRFENCDTCWLVQVAETCEGSTCTPLSRFNAYETCIACTLIEPEPEPEPLNIRLVKPGYNTPGCPPEYTEKINCRFANAVYDQMVVVRYGIKMCCDIEQQKYDIKKQLLELKAIYDPNMCGFACITPSCPEPDVEYPIPTPVPPRTPG